MEIKSKICLDLQRVDAPPIIFAKQGDVGSRTVEISLTDNHVLWPIPAGSTAVIRYRKASGAAGMYDTLPGGKSAYTVDASNGTITITLVPQILAEPGRVRCDVAIISGAQFLATFDFAVQVNRSPIDAADLESQDYYKVASLEQINAALDARVKTVNGIAPDEDGNVQIPTSGGTCAVASVNGKTGAVVLDAASVGAVPAAGGKMTGDLNMWGRNIINAVDVASERFTVLSDEDPDAGAWIAVENPITDTSGTPTKQVLAVYGSYGDEATILRNVAAPEQTLDVANKGYVDDKIAEIGTSGGTAGADGGYYTPSVAADGVLSWAGSKPDMPPVQPANIKGSPGADGAPGQDGAPGADGKSAYQLAVEAGFTGTMQEWLASLKGAPGQDGADGSPGSDGKGIVSVVRTSGSGAAGTVDTYTITYTDGTTSTFQVWNGENGTNGGYYTPSVSEDGELVFMASKTGMPPVGAIDLHEYISEILPGGYCSTGVAVADKIESYISKEIVAGSLVSIQFAGTNTASNPTLTVNGVKAAIVGGNGEAISPAMLGAGERVFLYTTSQKWVLINPQVSALPTATASDAGKVATVGSNGSYGLAYPQMPVVTTTVTNIEMQPNVRYRWGVVSSLTLSFADEIPGIVNEYCGEFYSGDPATNFMCPASVNWVTPLNIESGKRYEFSIVNEIGVMSGV